MNFKVTLVVPTLNAGNAWPSWIKSIQNQRDLSFDVLVIDSSSTDSTARLASEAGFQVKIIERKDFNHGRTRQLAVDQLADRDVIVFMTQDAICADNICISRLVESFSDPAIGAAYGRQLPHHDADPIASHARFFNYPEQGHVVSRNDIARMGLKSAFISNSFAAYRREALMGIGGFPSETIMNEDSYSAAKMLLEGWHIAYCSEAKVHHSHNYSITQDFKRYFDIGVFHAQQPWIRERLGQAEGEGMKFVRSEFFYLMQTAPIQVFGALMRTIAKYSAYRLGLSESRLPLGLKRRVSMHRNYWITSTR
ncbi:MAG: O antigen biosynthesis rhamnosyltransferase RfbN [Nevskia sp.]